MCVCVCVCVQSLFTVCVYRVVCAHACLCTHIRVRRLQELPADGGRGIGNAGVAVNFENRIVCARACVCVSVSVCLCVCVHACMSVCVHAHLLRRGCLERQNERLC